MKLSGKMILFAMLILHSFYDNCLLILRAVSNVAGYVPAITSHVSAYATASFVFNVSSVPNDSNSIQASLTYASTLELKSGYLPVLFTANLLTNNALPN